MSIEVRLAEEKDTDGISEVFLASYGEEYCYTSFLDSSALRKLILSDNTIIVVAVEKDSQKVLGTASVLEERGAYTDLVGEFGRLVVHPEARGRGIGKLLMQGRLDRVENRLHIGIMDARAVHPYSMKIATYNKFYPVGYLPGKVVTNRRENVVLMVRYFNDALTLRKNHPQLIPEAYPIACEASDNCELPLHCLVDDHTQAYPLQDDFVLDKLQTEGYAHLLRIERGRLTNREIFGSLQLHYGLFKLRAKNSVYLIARHGDTIIGAIGYIEHAHDSYIKIFELISLHDGVIRFLLGALVEQCMVQGDCVYMEADVSAYAPAMQRTFLELGFIPSAFVPGLVFHQTERLDIVKMIRLGEQANFEHDTLIPEVSPIADIVQRSFQKLEIPAELLKLLHTIQVFEGFNEEQRSQIASCCHTKKLSKGEVLFKTGEESDALYYIFQGCIGVTAGESKRQIVRLHEGNCLGEVSLLSDIPHSSTATALSNTHLGVIPKRQLMELIRRRPDLGVILYKNLAQTLGEKLSRSNSLVGGE